MGSVTHLQYRLCSFVLIFFLIIHNIRSERSMYIVHMDKSLMPKIFSDHHEWYTSTVESAKKPGPTSSVRSQLIYSYNHALHGFSAVLTKGELETVKKFPGFVSAYPNRKVKLRTTHTPDFLSLTPTAGLWPASNYGSDSIIGLVETGIWPESESFKDEGMPPVPSTWKGTCQVGQDFNASMCNRKLVGAKYFNKGLLAQDPSLNITMNSARDTSGHGTHMSATAGGSYVQGASFFGYANGTAKGVAPRARVAMYKTLFEEGETMPDILAAIDEAIADGVHVLSLSIGFDEDLQWYENPIAISCFAALEKGIVVSHGGGNTGPHLYSLYDSIPWTITVGAGSIDRSFSGRLTLGNGITIDGWTAFPANALVFEKPLVYNKTISCNSIESLSDFPSDSIIICEGTHIAALASNATTDSANFAGFIFIAEPVEDIHRPLEFPWPGILINPSDGAKVIDYVTTSNTSWASMTFQLTTLGIKPAPAVSSYSSRGPLRSYPDLLKPDILAPGTLVLASWIPNQELSRIGGSIPLKGDFNILSGTSVACPHISGVAALLKSVHTSWSASAIKSSTMTTADPLDNTGGGIMAYGGGNMTFASSLDKGSGHVVPNQALDPGLVYDATPEDYVNLMCSLGYTKDQLLTVTRSNRYNCSNPSADLNYPSFISVYTNTTVTQTFERTVTNVGNDSSTYSAKVIAPLGSNITVSPDKLVFGQMYEQQKFTLKIEYVVEKNGTVMDGSLAWIEEGGTHKVRSPIVVAPRITF